MAEHQRPRRNNPRNEGGQPIADPNAPPPPYQPKDAVARSLHTTTMTAGAGLFISTIQNTLTRQPQGAWGVLTRFGGTVGVFAAMGGAYEFSKCASANLREKNDAWNSSIGGFFAGTMLGLRFRTAPFVVGFGAAGAVLFGAFSYTGGKMSGLVQDKDVDEVARKENLRKNRRRPVEETVHQLGEGRGIYAPGYPARRAERIKEAYGIDVTNPAPAVHPPTTS